MNRDFHKYSAFCCISPHHPVLLNYLGLQGKNAPVRLKDTDPFLQMRAPQKS